MTQQVDDLVVVDDDAEVYAIYPPPELPLTKRKHFYDPSRSVTSNTGCNRGYQAFWRLSRGRLFIDDALWPYGDGLEEGHGRPRKMSMLADWVSGDFHIVNCDWGG